MLGPQQTKNKNNNICKLHSLGKKIKTIFLKTIGSRKPICLTKVIFCVFIMDVEGYI